MKIKIKSAAQIKSFPAEASPTGGRDVLFSGTGFSREEAGVFTINFAACPLTHSRLKPVPLNARDPTVGPASAGKRPVLAPSILQCSGQLIPDTSIGGFDAIVRS